MMIDINYLGNLAEEESKLSNDRRVKIGCIIVDDSGTILSKGHNRLPEGIADEDRKQDPSVKLHYFDHGERNAIFNAAKNGIKINNATMICNCDMSCSDCAIAIISSGIKSVWFKKGKGVSRNHPKWKQSCNIAEEMLIESGVGINYY